MNDLKVCEVFDVDRKAGEIGIEIEVEGMGMRNVDPPQTWRLEADGSLRGEGGEFVLRNPAKRENLRKVLLQYKRMVNKVAVRDTFRAGIHVHINVQDMTMREVVQYLTLYYIFENSLVRWCGADRVGNLFCLRASDAGGVLSHLEEIIAKGKWHGVHTDEIRYASMNLKALSTYGSIEFRAMRSTTDINLIEAWVLMLLILKDEARKYKNPYEIIERLSFENTEKFFNRIFGDSPLEYNREEILDGMRNAQGIAYAKRDWDAHEVQKDRPVLLREIAGEVEEQIPRFKLGMEMPVFLDHPPGAARNVARRNGFFRRSLDEVYTLRYVKGKIGAELYVNHVSKIFLSDAFLEGLKLEGAQRNLNFQGAWVRHQYLSMAKEADWVNPGFEVQDEDEGELDDDDIFLEDAQ